MWLTFNGITLIAAIFCFVICFFVVCQSLPKAVITVLALFSSGVFLLARLAYSHISEEGIVQIIQVFLPRVHELLTDERVLSRILQSPSYFFSLWAKFILSHWDAQHSQTGANLISHAPQPVRRLYLGSPLKDTPPPLTPRPQIQAPSPRPIDLDQTSLAFLFNRAIAQSLRGCSTMGIAFFIDQAVRGLEGIGRSPTRPYAGLPSPENPPRTPATLPVVTTSLMKAIKQDWWLVFAKIKRLLLKLTCGSLVLLLSGKMLIDKRLELKRALLTNRMFSTLFFGSSLLSFSYLATRRLN